MSEQALRVGIIGVGNIAMISRAPVLRSTPHVQITAISRRREKQLAMAQEHLGVREAYTDWREMLDKAPLDAVLVCTPHDLHAEQTIAALQRGLHVLVDKPMALTVKNAQSMVEAARKAGRVLMTTYGGRFDGRLRTAKKALSEGAIGTLRQVNWTHIVYRRFFWIDKMIPPAGRGMLQRMSGMTGEFYSDWHLEDEWWSDPHRVGGGAFADIGAHHIDTTLWLGGARPVEVVAMSESAGLPVECFMNVQARLANGVLLSLLTADADPGALLGRGTCWIVGDDGTLTLDLDGHLWIESKGTRQELKPELPDIGPEVAFVQCVLEGKPNLSPGEDGVYAVALAEAAYRSAAEGQVIRLSLP